MHIIIATRSDPPLPLFARLRSQNQLTELRTADLSFNAEETADLFNKSLSGPRCDALTHQENSQQMLNTLVKADLFLIQLDDERSWYRYRHLFADLLKQQLRLQPGELESELHRRASQWLSENGFKYEAVDHAFASQNTAEAAQLIEEIAEIYWDDARESRLLQ